MSDTTGKLSREEANRRLLENVEAWKRFELESDVARWRDATPAERAAAGASLTKSLHRIARDAGVRYVPEWRSFPRLDLIRRQA